MLLAVSELKPLFERFGITTISEVLGREIEAEAKNISMRVYAQSESKLLGPSHSSTCFFPEPIASVDYSRMPTQLPTVTILEGVVSVNGDVCERACVDAGNSSVHWSRSLGDPHETYEHGVLIIEPTNLSAAGQVTYTRDLHGNDPLPTVLPVQFLAMGTGAAVASSVVSGAAAAPQHYAGAMAEEVAAEVPAREVTQNDSQASKAEQLKPTAATALPSSNQQPTPIIPPTRFDMIYDEAKFKDGQVEPRDPLPFGPIELSVGRNRAEGMAYTSLFVPELDNLLALCNDALDPQLGKVDALYDNAVTRLADGRIQGTIRIRPDVAVMLDHMKDKQSSDEFSQKLTFKKSTGSDASLAILFSRIEIIFGADRKTATGSIWEWDTRNETREGTKYDDYRGRRSMLMLRRHLFLSNPGELAQPTTIGPRQTGAISAGGINTASPTTPISSAQKPPSQVAIRMGQFAPFHVQSLQNVQYDEAAVSTSSLPMSVHRRLTSDIGPEQKQVHRAKCDVLSYASRGAEQGV